MKHNIPTGKYFSQATSNSAKLWFYMSVLTSSRTETQDCYNVSV